MEDHLRVMYKRTKEAIDNHPPSERNVMFKAQFGNAQYSDIAFSITTVVDSSGAYGVII